MVPKVGHGIYRLALPAIRRMLRGSRRVRVLITVGDEVLLVKNLISRQRWMLPGGGIHSDESPQQAAARELQEELRLRLPAKSFRLLDEFDYADEHRIAWRAYLLHAELVKKPELTPNRFELIDASWHPKNELPSGYSPLIDKALGLINR